MKNIFKFLAVILMILIAVVLLRDYIAFSFLSNYLQHRTGLQCKVDSFHIGLDSAYVEIKNLIVLNPNKYPEPLMAYVPYVYIEYDPLLLFEKKARLELIQLDLKQFNVVKLSPQEVNIRLLKFSKAKERPADYKRWQFFARELELKIDEVNMLDYSQGQQPEEKKFMVNINEQFSNVDNFKGLLKIIMIKALAKTTISDMVNLNLPALKQDVQGALNSSVSLLGKAFNKVKDATKNVVEKTGDVVDSVFEKDTEGED